MAKISSNVLFVIICLQISSLSACGQINQKDTPSPVTQDEVNVYDGYYRYGENLSSFVPCEMGYKPDLLKGYWLITNDEFDEMYQAESIKMINAAIGTLGPNDTMGLYIKIKGRPSPPIDTASGKGYGYQNQYQREITVTQVLTMKYFILPYDIDLCQSE